MLDIQKYNFPTSIVILGGTGDLAQTKLFPALLDLYAEHVLPDAFTIIGLSRKDLSDEEYRAFVRKSLPATTQRTDAVIDTFLTHIHYVSGNFDDADMYERLKTALHAFDDSIAQCTSKLFYLAVPPHFYSQIFAKLKESNAMALCDGVGSWSRLLVEKPFGRDLETANALEAQLCELFSEDQIYRIDHYLAKDAIENIIALRFANSIISDSWTKEYIESIAVRLYESKDVSNRGSFYDGIGALRDVGQNHMMQMLALLTMRNVNVHDPLGVREARAQALASFGRQTPKEITRGQYTGFTETTGVAPNSETETYFKIETELDTTAWKGVRFILESGKALTRSVTEAVVTFRALDLCQCEKDSAPHKHQNVLKITFSPEHRISLTVWVKKPGFDFILEPRELEFAHTKSTDTYSPEAYERVLFDCIAGDQTRFVSGAEVRAAWEFITPILSAFPSLPLYSYAPGTSGPNTATTH